MYNSTELKVRKWGNSLGIRIPKHLAEIMHIQDGSSLRLTFHEDHMDLCLSDIEEEGTVLAEDAVLQEVFEKKRVVTPDYSSRPRKRETHLTLTDKNFRQTIGKYPFVIVLFIDYMYLDFYDRIEERLLQIKELAS